MLEFIKNGILFIKKNPSILYSLVLIILLPAVLFINTFYTIQSFQKAIDNNLQAQSITINNILGPIIKRDFPGPDKLNLEMVQYTIDLLIGNIPANGGSATGRNLNVDNIRVVIKEGMDYKVIAAQDHAEVGGLLNTDPSFNGETMVTIAWGSATDMMGWVEQAGDRYWRILKVFKDEAGVVYGLIVADIPTRELDSMIAQTVLKSAVILIISIIISLSLIFQHTRLFAYVSRTADLEAKCKIKDQFIRMAGHELQSPITNMRWVLEALQEEVAANGTDIQKQYMGRITSSVNGLSKLVTDILEVSHLEQGKMDFDPQMILPAEIIAQIVNNVKLKAEGKGLKISFQSNDFHYYINANLARFTQIITNLVENAIKYTPAGQVSVSIVAETGRRRCVITVQDTGFGISAEGQKRMFEQFYRVKTEANAGIPGTGLGLWMSREMARKMGGDIMLESIERMGSRFFVYFPLSDKPKAS